jgi:hypothetical protein
MRLITLLMILFMTGCASSDLEEFAYGVLVAATEESERSNTQGINYDGNPAVYCSQLKNTYRTIQRNLSTYDRNIREYENQGRKANNKSRADWYNRKANQERRAKNADLKKINEIRTKYRVDFQTNDGKRDCADISGYLY